ncbi:hypothetical protein ElyMa_000081000 [Elysia marginata]|uniref:Ig-like domain-containing protein n=1 Tax=Elysia marginata TaxID=1093978 RepID=A0AAV4EJ68_9GAST|nr:hypothetical protein ElyMa_000081000 [Elysia marginata]
MPQTSPCGTRESLRGSLDSKLGCSSPPRYSVHWKKTFIFWREGSGTATLNAASQRKLSMTSELLPTNNSTRNRIGLSKGDSDCSFGISQEKF